MRMEVVTHDRMVSLGFIAKDIFAKHVLTVDDDGKSFDTLQTIQEDTHSKIDSLPVQGGITESIKTGIIDAFSRMKVGDKFLCLNAWITNYESEEAKFYWEVQKLCNQGHNLKEGIALAKDWLNEYRKPKIVKIKEWEQLREEYGFDQDDDIACEGVFSRLMNEALPKDRIISIQNVSEHKFPLWFCGDISEEGREHYDITPDMIEKFL